MLFKATDLKSTDLLDQPICLGYLIYFFILLYLFVLSFAICYFITDCLGVTFW